uniref:Uncharacterized protein n=1 Tax=Rhizophora mucronata TaxID=61149 RepID=A0A2P2PBU0_RHIMU
MWTHTNTYMESMCACDFTIETPKKSNKFKHMHDSTIEKKKKKPVKQF